MYLPTCNVGNALLYIDMSIKLFKLIYAYICMSVTATVSFILFPDLMVGSSGYINIYTFTIFLNKN